MCAPDRQRSLSRTFTVSSGGACPYRRIDRGFPEAGEDNLTGEPGKLGQDFLQEWAQGPPQFGARAVVQATAIRAFAFFGIATVINLFAMHHYADRGRYESYLFPGVFTLVFFSARKRLPHRTFSARADMGGRQSCASALCCRFHGGWPGNAAAEGGVILRTLSVALLVARRMSIGTGNCLSGTAASLPALLAFRSSDQLKAISPV